MVYEQLRIEDIKKRLADYKFVKAEINELKLQIEELRSEIGPSGISYDDKGGSTNKFSSATENEVIKIAEKEDKLKKIINRKGIEVTRIENCLEVLNEKERQAIELRFVEGYELSTVCYKMDRSIATVKRNIKNALKKMVKLLYK